MPQPPNELPIPTQDTTIPSVQNDQAVSLIRQKLANIYGEEPTAAEEEKEIEAIGAQSKHQRFIKQLMQSGKDLVEVQTAWHQYYQLLPDHEKHEVWQEFYANHARSSKYLRATTSHAPQHTPHVPLQHTVGTVDPFRGVDKETEAPGDIKAKILKKASGGGKLKKAPSHPIVIIWSQHGTYCGVYFYVRVF